MSKATTAVLFLTRAFTISPQDDGSARAFPRGGVGVRPLICSIALSLSWIEGRCVGRGFWQQADGEPDRLQQQCEREAEGKLREAERQRQVGFQPMHVVCPNGQFGF